MNLEAQDIHLLLLVEEEQPRTKPLWNHHHTVPKVPAKASGWDDQEPPANLEHTHARVVCCVPTHDNFLLLAKTPDHVDEGRRERVHGEIFSRFGDLVWLLCAC